MNVETMARAVKPDSVAVTASVTFDAADIFSTIEERLGRPCFEDEVTAVLDALVATCSSAGGRSDDWRAGEASREFADAFDLLFDMGIEKALAVIEESVAESSADAFGAEPVETDENGLNVKIRAHVLDDDAMRAAGFTDRNPGTWYLCRRVAKETSFNVSIEKETERLRIDVLDEQFLQPYDYQGILARNPRHKFAGKVRDRVEDEMKKLAESGIVTGHVRGEYI